MISALLVAAAIIWVLVELVIDSERETLSARATLRQRRAWRRDRLDLNAAHRGRWV